MHGVSHPLPKFVTRSEESPPIDTCALLMKCTSHLCGSQIDCSNWCRCSNRHLFWSISLVQYAPEQSYRGHNHVKDWEDSTASFKQVFLVYIDQKLWSREKQLLTKCGWSLRRLQMSMKSYLMILGSRIQQAIMDNGCDPFQKSKYHIWWNNWCYPQRPENNIWNRGSVKAYFIICH